MGMQYTQTQLNNFLLHTKLQSHYLRTVASISQIKPRQWSHTAHIDTKLYTCTHVHTHWLKQRPLFITVIYHQPLKAPI